MKKLRIPLMGLALSSLLCRSASVEPMMPASSVYEAADAFAAWIESRSPEKVAFQPLMEKASEQCLNRRAGISLRIEWSSRDVPAPLLAIVVGGGVGGVCGHFMSAPWLGSAIGGGILLALERGLHVLAQIFFSWGSSGVSSDVEVALPVMALREQAETVAPNQIVEAKQIGPLFLSRLRHKHHLEAPKHLSPSLWLNALALGAMPEVMTEPQRFQNAVTSLAGRVRAFRLDRLSKIDVATEDRLIGLENEFWKAAKLGVTDSGLKLALQAISRFQYERQIVGDLCQFELKRGPLLGESNPEASN